MPYDPEPEARAATSGVQHMTACVEEDAGVRLDRFLAARIGALSRARLQALIRGGCISLEGAAVTDPGRKVRANETFTIAVPETVAAEPAPESIPLTVVFEDEDVIVIDKPAGLVVHPAAGHASGTLVNALIAHCGASLSGIGGVRRPGIVHRLDKDTSGLLVVAKNDRAHAGLSAQFEAHGADGRLEREYVGLCWGAPDRPAGSISARLARSAVNRKKIAVAAGQAGRHAVTHYRVTERFFATGADEGPKRARIAVAALRLILETGRTHQIRVHLAHIGHPLLGDATYGAGFKASAGRLGIEAQDALAELGRQALHAAVLGFAHPRTGKSLRFESPLPDDMKKLEVALRERA